MMGAPPPSWLLTWSSEGRVDVYTLEQILPVLVLLLLVLLDGGKTLSCLFLPLGVLVESVPNLLLAILDGGESGVKMRVFHLLLMITCGMVMVAMDREGHASSLMATRDLTRLLLVVVKIVVLPLPTWALLPGTL